MLWGENDRKADDNEAQLDKGVEGVVRSASIRRWKKKKYANSFDVSKEGRM